MLLPSWFLFSESGFRSTSRCPRGECRVRAALKLDAVFISHCSRRTKSLVQLPGFPENAPCCAFWGEAREPSVAAKSSPAPAGRLVIARRFNGGKAWRERQSPLQGTTENLAGFQSREIGIPPFSLIKPNRSSAVPLKGDSVLGRPPTRR